MFRAVLLVLVLLHGCGGDAASPGADGGRSDAAPASGGRGGSGPSGGGGAPAGGAGGAAVGTGGAAPSGGAGGVTAPDASPSETAPSEAGSDGARSPSCGACTAWGAPRLLGQVTATALNALSGLAGSWRNPGVVYVHNDRNRPEIFALGETATLATRLTLAGPGVVGIADIEDIEVARCPGGTCLYVADIGNNISPRSEFSIFRAPEPALGPGAAPSSTLAVERFAFRYADQPHNAESLLVDAGSGSVYVITKVAAGQPSAVYVLSTFDAGRVNEAVKVADLPVPAAADTPATAGSAHPCGGGFLLRTNNTLYEFRTPLGTPLAQAFAVIPTKVPVGQEQQGEAVSYRADGRGYYTTSEGAMPPLHAVTCN